MRMREIVQVASGLFAVGIVAIVADTALASADAAVSASRCCFTQTCGDQSVQDCRSGCASNEVCSGSGGCNPIWADARCIRRTTISIVDEFAAVVGVH